MPASPDLTAVGILIISVCVVVFLFVLGAWILAPFMLYGIDSRLGETNEFLRCLIAQVRATQVWYSPRPPAVEPPAQNAGVAAPTFQLLR